MANIKVKQKILLVEPPFYRLFKETYSFSAVPLSLSYLSAAVLNNTDWEVLIFNADFVPRNEKFELSYFFDEGYGHYQANLESGNAEVWRKIDRVIRDFSPGIVGISVKSATLMSSLRVAGIAKGLNSNITVLVGGPHVSCVGEKVLEYPEFDLAITGEGEATIVELLLAMELQKDFSGIKGIIYKKDNKIRKTPDRMNIEPLDSIGFPVRFKPGIIHDYGLFPLKGFSRLMTGRGCPFNCSFCGSKIIWGRKPRLRSVNSVIKEISLMRKHSVENIHFDDDTFGVSRGYTRELCESIGKTHRGVTWSCETHVNLIDEEMLRLVRENGCKTIQLGIESGSDRILKLTEKGFSSGKALSACEMIKKSGLRLEVFFMVGFPFETESSMNETFEIIRKIDSDKIIYSVFTPYPGTEIYDYCIRRGIISEHYNFSRYFHQSPDNHFCPEIPYPRFREIACRMEEYITRKNKK